MSHFPELKESYEDYLKWWGSEVPGPHNVNGDLLNPYLEHLPNLGDDAGLRRVFDFLEILSCNVDVKIHEVVAYTVCEYFGNFDKEQRWKLKQFMGPVTTKFMNEVENY